MENEELKLFFGQLYSDAFVPKEFLKDYPEENLCFGESRIGKVAFAKDLLEENSVKLYQLFKEVSNKKQNIYFNDLKKAEVYSWTGNLWPFDDLLALGTATGFIHFKKDKTKWTSEEMLNPELVMAPVLFEDIDLSKFKSTKSSISDESAIVSKIIALYKKCVTTKEDEEVCYGQNRIKKVAFNKTKLNNAYKTISSLLKQFNLNADRFSFNDLKVLKNGFRLPLDVVEYLLAMAHAIDFIQYEETEEQNVRNPSLQFTLDYKLCEDLPNRTVFFKNDVKRQTNKGEELAYLVTSLYEKCLAQSTDKEICLGKNRTCSVFFNKTKLNQISDEVSNLLKQLLVQCDCFSFNDLKLIKNRFCWVKDESVVDCLLAMSSALGILEFASYTEDEERDDGNPKLIFNTGKRDVQLNLIEKKFVKATSSNKEKAFAFMTHFYKKYFKSENYHFFQEKRKKTAINRGEQFSTLVLTLYEKCLASSINEEICYGCNRDESIAFNKKKLEKFFPDICQLLKKLSINSKCFSYNDLKMMKNHLRWVKDDSVVDCLLAMANGLGIIQFSKQIIECEEDYVNPELFITDAYFLGNTRQRRLKIS